LTTITPENRCSFNKRNKGLEKGNTRNTRKRKTIKETIK
jgi:hypothetical protein